MVFLFLCDACLKGDHEHCSKGFSASKGKFGGSKCNCFAQNHQRDNSYELKFNKEIPSSILKSLNKNFLDLL